MKKITLLTALLSLFAPGRSTSPRLRDVGYFNDLKHSGQLHVSLAGGSILQMNAKEGGLNKEPVGNSVQFKNWDLFNSELTVQARSMDDQDEFRSEPGHNNMISYTLPHMDDLMERYGMARDWFEAFDAFSIYAEIKANGDTLSCEDLGSCQIIPHWLYTPISYGMSPSVVYPGQQTTLIVNPLYAPQKAFDSTFMRNVDVKLDDVALDRNLFMDSDSHETLTLANNRVQYVMGSVDKDAKRTKESKMTAYFHGAGFAYKQKLSSITCNFENTDCYDVRINPAITEVKQHVGYTTGGQELVISGISLNGTTIDVQVDGTECAVTDSSFYEVRCRTGASTVSTVQDSYVGQHGLRLKLYQNNHVSHDNFDTYGYIDKPMLTSYEIAQQPTFHYDIARITGYFEAPVDGQYQFHMSCDDTCRFHLSLTDPTDPAAMELLISRVGSQTDYNFRSSHTYKYKNASTKIELTDASTVADRTWADLKLSAMDADYKLLSAYTDLSTDDQTLFDALVDAQTAQNDESPLTSTFVSTDLSDATVIGDTTWADLRTSAMAFDYQTTDAYTNLSTEDSAIVDALIAAQTTQADELELTGASPYTTGHEYTDLSTVDGKTWQLLKVSAMDAAFLLTADYITLVEDDKDLLIALVAAQTAQGDSLQLTAVTYKEDDSHIGTVFSEWVTLAAGTKYYTESTLMAYGGNDHITVGVEIAPTDPASAPTDHPQQTPQYQRLEVTQDLVRDTSVLTVVNPDMEVEYLIMFQDPADVENYIPSEKIKAGDSAANVQSAIKAFYEDTITDTPPAVTLACFDANSVERACSAVPYNACIDPTDSDIEITCVTCMDVSGVDIDCTDALATQCVDSSSTPATCTVYAAAKTTYVYTIQVLRSLAQDSCTAAQVITTSTTTTISLVLPQDGTDTQSNAPLSGTFFIECYEIGSALGIATEVMNFDMSTGDVKKKIIKACPNLRNKFELIWTDEPAKYSQDGLNWILFFENVPETLPQFKIHTNENSEFGEPLAGVNLNILNTEIQPRGPNIYYKVIPFEYIYTNEASPQVMVQIDDQAALCKSQDCGYVYEDPTSEVTVMTVTIDGGRRLLQEGQDVSITGTTLPTDIESVTIGHTDCGSITSDSTTITCTLATPLIAGSWEPEVRDAKGLLPVADSMVATDVELTFTSVTPSADLNPAGGDTLTIEGTGFPSQLGLPDDVISIQFADGTECDLISTTSTQMECTTRAFGANYSPLTVVPSTGLAKEVEVTTDPAPKTVDSITPATASPILVEELVLQLASDYDTTNMSSDEFAVSLTPCAFDLSNICIDEEGKIRKLAVIDVDVTDLQITVKYGGAYSGFYNVKVHSREWGNLETNGLTFEAKIQITDFNPKTGSKFGGSLVTIDGINFSDNPQDNPVKIGYEIVGGVNHYCYVKSTSFNQIVCRMAPDYTRNHGAADLIVFASTSEEATFADGLFTQFTFVDSADLPTITSMNTGWSDTDLFYTLTIDGADITDADISTVDVFLGGKEQEIVSVSPTEIVVKIVDLDSGLDASTIEIYTVEGLPNGLTETLFTDGLTVDPQLVGLSMNTGSASGGIIYAVVEGAGVEDDLTLVDSSGADVCTTATMKSYSLLECIMGANAYTTAEQFSVKATESGTTYSCGNSDVSQCQYTTSASSPTATSATDTNGSKTDYVFYGTNLNAFGSTCEVEIQGLVSDSCVIDSDTSVTVHFTNGVPVALFQLIPELRLLDDCSVSLGSLCTDADVKNKNVATALPDSDAIAINNALVITNDAAKTLSCSFAGGCSRSIESQGLMSSIQLGQAKIEVCGMPCEMDVNHSTSSTVSCEVPPIQSLGSIAAGFEIYEVGEIRGTIIQSSTFEFEFLDEQFGLAFDGEHLPGLVDTGANCYMGMMFEGDTSGYSVGALTELRVFMDYVEDKSVHTGNLIFQGSNLGFDLETNDILTIGEELHEGMNYYKMDDTDLDIAIRDPKYRYYRLFNAEINGCDKIGEIMLIGQKVFDSTDDTHMCSVAVRGDYITTQIGVAQVEYVASTTPYVTSISPRWGSVEGGTEVTFTGINFSDQWADYQIYIDDILCDVTQDSTPLSTTQVTCVTGARTGLWEEEPKLTIFIDNVGQAATQGHNYRYVSLWSSASTWGGAFQPVEGESVAVTRGINLLFDLDESPELNLIILDGGSLIFPSDPDSNHQRTFDAHYIFLNNNAYMEIGTEDEPYTSKMTLTMHGERYDPYIPKFGNKCIGVRYSTLDIHGVPRDKTWTSLDSTAEVGATSITLIEDVDWQVGEEIVIASTDLGIEDNEIPGEGDNSEQRTITQIVGRVVSFADPLRWEHYSAIDSFGDDTIEMRAEVGLLTRNVKYQGDPETSLQNQYGATIMLHSPGDESVIGRISHAEFFNVGQSFQIGRYPIHFHMIGEVNKSYVIGNAIHNSFNRGTTIHGVHYLRVTHNVYYHCKGHNLFIEDGVETRNYIAYNLIMQVRASHSILNTDTTPAGLWMTNPDNIVVGNHVAGGSRYGFWYDLQKNSIGPSASKDICPINQKLGEFRDNVAHSVGRYGLRIFHEHFPRKYQCRDIVFDVEAHERGENPYIENPVIVAEYRNFTAYKCARNGVIAEHIGAVRFIDIKTVDNTLAGIEVNRIKHVRDDPFGGPWIDGAVIVGRSEKSANYPETFQGVAQDDALGLSAAQISPCGVITAQTDFFAVKNVRFYNFNFNVAAAIGTCSHCFKPPATHPDGVTTGLENISIDTATVPRNVRWQFPHKSILHDRDGTLTGSTGAWVISNNPLNKHNAYWPECEEALTYDGYICNNSHSVRRILIFDAEPGNIRDTILYILPYDQSIIGTMDEQELSDYEGDDANYAQVPMRFKKDPFNHWCAPFVTGHNYYMRWAHGLDIESMRIEIVEPLWTLSSDKDIHLELPFFDKRENIFVDYDDGTRMSNMTMSTSSWSNTMGANNVHNNTFEDDFMIPNVEQRFKLTLSQNPSSQATSSHIDAITLTGVRPPQVTEIEEMELGEQCLWSNPACWKSGALPVEDDHVVIEGDQYIILDIAETPRLRSLEINGKLAFSHGGDRAISSYKIWVRAGELHIGSEAIPFEEKAVITLLGDNTEEYWSFTAASETGNKGLVVTGDVQMWGKARDQVRCRLQQTAYALQNEVYIESGLDWAIGETFGIAATNMRTMDFDYCEIETYEIGSGKVTCKENLEGYHFGAGASTEAEWEVDMRAEVFLLDRNIKIQASTDDVGNIIDEPWGGRIMVADFFEPTLVRRVGSMNLDNVQVYNCSQKHTYKAAITWTGASSGASRVTNSVLSSGRGLGVLIENSANIEISDSIIADFVQHGIWVQASSSITIDRNWVHHVQPEVYKPSMFAYPIIQAFAIGGISTSDGNSKVKVRDNVVSGTWHHGFHFVPNECDVTEADNPSHVFEGNVAHSISGYGAIALNTPKKRCMEVHNFKGYKCTQATIHLGTSSDLNVGTNIVSHDSHYGIAIMSGGGGDVLVKDSTVYGENTDNQDCPPNSRCDHCVSTIGIVANMPCPVAQPDHKTKWFKLPLFKLCTSSMTSQASYEDIKFKNFDSPMKTCGKHQFTVGPWGTQSDYVGYMEYLRPVFTNVVQDALVRIFEPKQEWKNWEDCGIEFTCTGLYNAVMKFKSASGIAGLPSHFDVISNNVESTTSSIFTDSICEFKEAWNANLCESKFGVMIFDSLDIDRMDRNVAPVYIKNDDVCNGKEGEEKECWNNRLNSFMDNCWDGFYGCQTREQRYPTMVYADAEYYQIEYTGTPPESQMFRLFGDSSLTGFLIRVVYSNSNSYQIFNDDGQVVPGTKWNDLLEDYEPVSRGNCGENRYQGLTNTLEFWLSPDCPLTIRPREAVQLGVRLEFTMSEFFESGGVTSFIDNMAGVLGIHKSDIKVVSVYEGSTIVDFEILQNLAAEIPVILEDVAKVFEEAVAVMDTFMGSSVLEAISIGIPIITPNTELDENGGIATEFFNIWDEPEDPQAVVDPNLNAPNIDVEIRYRVQESEGKNSANTSTTGFLAIILCVIVIVMLVILSICLYKKINNHTQFDKNHVPDSVRVAEEFEEMEGIEKQYDPKQELRSISSFGGSPFKKTNTLKKANLGDSLSKMCGLEDESRDSTAPFKVFSPKVQHKKSPEKKDINVMYQEELFKVKTKRLVNKPSHPQNQEIVPNTDRGDQSEQF